MRDDVGLWWYSCIRVFKFEFFTCWSDQETFGSVRVSREKIISGNVFFFIITVINCQVIKIGISYITICIPIPNAVGFLLVCAYNYEELPSFARTHASLCYLTSFWVSSVSALSVMSWFPSCRTLPTRPWCWVNSIINS